METSNTAGKTSAPSNNKLIIAIAVLVVVIIGAVVTIVLVLNNQKKSNGLTIDYATNANVYLDQDSLQAAMDEAMKNAENGSVALRYVNDAHSEDGVNFDCYIANSAANLYDSFITIYADADLTDQVFLSGLLRPGSGFESVTLTHALEPGTNTVYVAVTLVETGEDGTQTIKGQVVHTMDFHVSE